MCTLVPSPFLNFGTGNRLTSSKMSTGSVQFMNSLMTEQKLSAQEKCINCKHVRFPRPRHKQRHVY